MSFSRALLWARLPAGRQAGHRAAICSALRPHFGPFPGVLGQVSVLATASSSASGGSKIPNTSLFVPLTVKPQGPSADGDVGAELTRPLDKNEVAVIDEIQMIRDPARGWAWTRALLGLCAEEVHLCGEPAAIDLVTELMYTTGEEVEVRDYKRLTPISVLDHALESLDNLRPGDCIVCFSKNDIYSVSRQIEIRGLESAVIYGSLPPGTKLAQAKKFNDPNDPCKILVATDAIGMGLNLSIRRIIFYSLIKPSINEKGERELE
ncbi:SUPV3L1 isoform 3, partial [Pan troglodytes]